MIGSEQDSDLWWAISFVPICDRRWALGEVPIWMSDWLWVSFQSAMVEVPISFEEGRMSVTTVVHEHALIVCYTKNNYLWLYLHSWWPVYCLVHRLGTGRKLVGKQILLLIARIQHISNHAADCKMITPYMIDVLIDENINCTCLFTYVQLVLTSSHYVSSILLLSILSIPLCKLVLVVYAIVEKLGHWVCRES